MCEKALEVAASPTWILDFIQDTSEFPQRESRAHHEIRKKLHSKKAKVMFSFFRDCH